MKSAAALAFVIGAPAAFACCGVGMAPVRFTGQSDIVIWDAERKVEHFVREAHFDSKSDLGFLAPVPTVPAFAEASPEAFDLLSRLTASSEWASAGAADVTTASRSVDVLKRENVAGYDAAVLKAGDAAALRGWLKTNGFPAPTWMESWVKPYLQKGWPIAAFRIRKGESQRPVRMTFETDKPFAPYAVPKENGGTGVPLRLYLVSKAGLEGRVGGQNWAGRENGEAKLENPQRAELARNLRLKPEEIPAGAIVTRFDDGGFGTEHQHDLTFEPTSESGFGTVGIGAAIVLVSVAAGRLLQRRR